MASFHTLPTSLLTNLMLIAIYSELLITSLNMPQYITIAILDIIHLSIFHFKLTVSETGFCLRLGVGAGVERQELSLPNWPE
jgi:hypothetical protein